MRDILSFLLILSLVVDGQSDGALRLVEGDTDYDGRVEVYYYGEWGTICDDSFNDPDAEVICRQLGFRTFSDYGYSASSTATGQIWLDNLFCFGSESRIDECSHNGVGEHNCQHSEDVYIRCTPSTTAAADGDLRLVEGEYTWGVSDLGSEIYGQVEVYSGIFADTWSTICLQSFNSREAQVVCRELGYDTVLYTGHTVETRETILDLHCNGDEARVNDCDMMASSSCSNSQVVVIGCTDPSTTPKYTVDVGLAVGLGLCIPLGLLCCIGVLCLFCCSRVSRDVKSRRPASPAQWDPEQPQQPRAEAEGLLAQEEGDGEAAATMGVHEPAAAAAAADVTLAFADQGQKTEAVADSATTGGDTATPGGWSSLRIWMFENLFFATMYMYINRYHDLFTQNGYETKDAIASLTKEDMNRIGIQNSLHQTEIMRAVKRMNTFAE